MSNNEKVLTRKERREADKFKEFAIKFTIIMIPIFICAFFFAYGKAYEMQYEGLRKTVLNHNGTLYQLKDKVK